MIDDGDTTYSVVSPLMEYLHAITDNPAERTRVARVVLKAAQRARYLEWTDFDLDPPANRIRVLGQREGGGDGAADDQSRVAGTRGRGAAAAGLRKAMAPAALYEHPVSGDQR